MTTPTTVEIDFPSDFTFKAFCDVGVTTEFRTMVLDAVNCVLPCSVDALRDRQSSGGRYCCVSVLVRVHNREQLEAIYAQLRGIEGLVYLL
jgi:putative lipoic acid-binding regulatory protein